MFVLLGSTCVCRTFDDTKFWVANPLDAPSIAEGVRARNAPVGPISRQKLLPGRDLGGAPGRSMASPLHGISVAFGGLSH